MGSRSVVEQYAKALNERDLDAQIALLHDDYLCRYPQSGEVIRRENYRAVVENYPAPDRRGMAPSFDRIIGSDDRWVTTPSFPAWSVVYLSGSGDDFTVTGTVTYPSGDRWHVVGLLKVRDGKIWRETDYLAEPFEPPEWRAPYAEIEEARPAAP